MYGRILALFLFLLASVLPGDRPVLAQNPVPATPTSLPPDLTSALGQETVAARKAAVQAQIEALVQANLPKEDLEVTRASLEQLLKVLTALEEVFQQRATYMSHIDTLPQRLKELEAERKTLEVYKPASFPTATEQLREEYEAQLQALRTEIQEISQQTAAGEVRLAGIPRELEQRLRDRQVLEKDLLAARSKITRTGEQKSNVEIDILDFKQQLVHAEEEALQAEHEWLTKHGPFQDARLSNAQVRLQRVQQNLETIKEALSKSIRQEQSSLSHDAATIEQKLGQATDPVEAFKLTVGLKIVEIKQHTATYRQQLNQLGDLVLGQDKENAQLKQEVNRLTALVEKHSSGEGIAQRLSVVFERLRRKRLRYSEGATKRLEAQLRSLTVHMFTLDDQLYDFPQLVDSQLLKLSAALTDMTPSQREASLAKARQVLDEQRAALREQQQVLTALVQDHTKLLALQREYTQLVEESYLSVLGKMFWLRDAPVLNWDIIQESLDGGMSAMQRFHVLVKTSRTYVSTKFSGSLYVWLLVMVVFLGVPWLVYRCRRRLLQTAGAYLAMSATRGEPPGMGVGGLLVVQAALWPAYMALLAWLLGQALPQTVVQTDLTPALVSGLQMAALFLGLGLLARSVLQPQGWGQRFWALPADLCRFLRRTIVWGCVAALVFMVPSYIWYMTSGESGPAGATLARVLSLAFQMAVFVMVGVLCWQRSPLMEVVLAKSLERSGLLKRIWPLVYLLLLCGILGLMTLDGLGYRYAARFIWLRLLGSLSVLFIWRLLVVILVQRLLQRLLRTLSSVNAGAQGRQTESHPAFGRSFSIVQTLLNGLLAVVACATILELWGVSVTWLLTSPTGTDILQRVIVTACAIGVTFAIIHLSTAITEYLVRPRQSVQGVVHDPGRKLKTLAPLVQTLIKVGAVFAATLVILEQLGVSTGPILTGVGIFGLAVGFASQSLIKDVINGLFMLFEDSLSVGDVVTLRGIGGQVEKVTLRAVTIRDLSGNVHVIPNSTVDMITNMTKEYSRYLLDVGVAYREDVDTVIAMLREIDESMRRDVAFGKDMLEPLEVMGLDRFEESAVIIRARLKTRPLQQWRIGREFNRRMKKIFDERHIEMPFPHRTLHWEQPKEGMPSPIRVAMENNYPAPRQDDY